MRIVFFTHYTDLLGANRSLLNLIEYLQLNSDAELCVIAPSEGPLCPVLRNWGINPKIIRFRYTYIPTNTYWKGKLVCAIHQIKDVFRLYFASSDLRKADIIYTNSSVIAHGIILSRLLRKPHIWHIREYGQNDYDLVPFFGEKIQSQLTRKSDWLVFISNHLKKAKSAWISNDTKSPVIYNGVFSPARQNYNKREYSKQYVKICYAGLMYPKKNAIEALDLLEGLHKEKIDAHLIVCASLESDYATLFKNEVIMRNLTGKVDFRGFVDDTKAVISECDYLIMPSRNEAMGRVTAEAMSVGVPVIGHKSGGTAELFEHGISGIYYNNIENAIAYVTSITNSDYAKLSQMAYNAALAKYTVEAYGEKIYEICQSLMSRRHD